jgi:hypothetical protein
MVTTPATGNEPTLGDEITLASGAKLRIQIAPFAVAKALYQAVLREVPRLEIASIGDVEVLLLKAFALGFSSQHIENALWECFKRCTYNDAKIDKDTFEPIEARGDYMSVCMEVAKSNIFPFMNGLFVLWRAGTLMAANALASEQTTTT